MTKSRAVRFILLLVVLHATALTNELAADDGDIKAAKRFIEKHAETILRVAHPTVTFLRVELDGTKQLRDGFALTYTFHWESSDRHWTTLSFTFDDDGKLDFIRTKARSNFLPPFTAANLAVQVVKEMLKEEPQLENNRKIARFLEEGNAKGMLEEYLKFKQ
jgi:hypothetical protein